MLAATLDGWAGLPWPLLCAAVAALAFLEGAALIGIVVPGESGVLAGSALASDAGAPLGLTLAAVTAAVVAGDLVGYAIGRRYGSRLEASRAVRLVGLRRWSRAQELLRRHGSEAVVIARFLPVAQGLTPMLAGAAGMSRRRFVRASALGSFVWSAAFVNAGYLADSAADTAGARIAVVAGCLLAVGLGGRLLAHRLGPSGSHHAPDGAGTGAAGTAEGGADRADVLSAA